MRELNGAVKVRILWARSHTLGKTTLRTLVPRGALMADPLRNVVLVGRAVLLGCTDIGTSCGHAEPFGELERFTHLTSAGIAACHSAIVQAKQGQG